MVDRLRKRDSSQSGVVTTARGDVLLRNNIHIAVALRAASTTPSRQLRQTKRTSR
jgi:hypothetical protein